MSELLAAGTAGTCSTEQEFSAGVRMVILNLPEDAGEGLGFRLTRTLWDPYSWVREVTPDSRAEVGGLRTGDCLLQADGKDLLGLSVSQVAGLIRGDGAGKGVSLLVWSCGVDPRDDPEVLWSCGGGARGERARRALSGVLRALACCVCGATAVRALCCARSHLYCEACWTRLTRCALCREALPQKDSPYAKNLVAEQVFEAIATEYEIKDAIKKPNRSTSAYSSPNRSPVMSSVANRRGQYQISMIHRKKAVQFNDKYGPNYMSDPNIHRSTQDSTERQLPNVSTNSTNINGNIESGNSLENGGEFKCHCQTNNKNEDPKKSKGVPKITIEGLENTENVNDSPDSSQRKDCCQNLRFISEISHKLVTRLRPACSLADLQNTSNHCCDKSRSLNNIHLSRKCHSETHHTGSLDDLKTQPACESPVLVLSPPPIYLLTCDHLK